MQTGEAVAGVYMSIYHHGGLLGLSCARLSCPELAWYLLFQLTCCVRVCVSDVHIILYIRFSMFELLVHSAMALSLLPYPLRPRPPTPLSLIPLSPAILPPSQPEFPFGRTVSWGRRIV